MYCCNEYCSQQKYDTATPDGNPGMRTPFIWVIDDIKMIGYPEINQHEKKTKQREYKVNHS